MLLLALALLSFGVAGIEIFSGWHWPGSKLTQLPYRPRYSNWASAWYHNVNNFSLFILIATIPALVMALNPATNHRTRTFFTLIWIIGFTITFQIYSRAVMIAYPLVVVTPVALLYSHNLRKLLSRIPVRVINTALPSFGVFLAGIFYFVPNPISNVGSSLWARWQLQEAAILEGGIFGQGLGNASTIISKASVDTGGITDPHSWYGAIVSETGIVGIILFLNFYGELLSGLFRMSDRTDSVQIMSVTALVALPVAGLGPSNVIRTPLWWIILGLSISTYSYLRRNSIK
jgi:hypothetical protein